MAMMFNILCIHVFFLKGLLACFVSDLLAKQCPHKAEHISLTNVIFFKAILNKEVLLSLIFYSIHLKSRMCRHVNGGPAGS